MTVNGEAALIIQSPEAYQELLEAVELADSVRVLRERVKENDAGEKAVPADEVLADIRKKLRLPRRR